MKKILTAIFLMAAYIAPAQTLFSYGKHSVSATEFVRAFQKNNNGVKNQKAIKDYLELYMASRLKIAEAKGQGYDTLPQLVTDLESLRQQILPSYLNDKESVNRLVTEAFNRSQKDIHLAHLFISFTKKGSTDLADAKKRVEEVMQKLKAGAKFDEMAAQYSDDPSSKTNGGDIGWVTVFTLPYVLENLAYATRQGEVSTIYQSKAGYHIFKNMAERKAVGRVRAAQILLAFPQGASDAEKAATKKKADSLYSGLQAGDQFGRFAELFSNDVVSSASNGQMPEFGISEFEPTFENVIYSLPKDSVLSKPFLTAHGYHIVQRLKQIPVSTTLDAATMETLRNKVEGSDRIQITKSATARRVLSMAGYKKLFSDVALWAYSDSLLQNKPASRTSKITPTTILFKLGDKNITTLDWTSHLQAYRYRADGSIKPYPQVWDEFTEATALQYYSDHLEKYNEEFKNQLNEFADGNLFFEIMQRSVWTPAQTDTLALATYYSRHKTNYMWTQSADAVVFYATGETSAKAFYDELKKKPSTWKDILANYNESITADSARFEIDQLPNNTNQAVQPGTITQAVTNKSDTTVSFAYVLKVYTKPEIKTLTEAKGAVISDYQTELEKQWIASLKKKYPVKLNEKVWKEVVNKIGK